MASNKLFCKTRDLRQLIPWEVGITYLERWTGIEARQLYTIKNGETFQTTEQTADRILCALNEPHLYHQLEFGPKEKMFHGVTGYKKGCRCPICRTAKKAETRRHYVKQKAAKMAA